MIRFVIHAFAILLFTNCTQPNREERTTAKLKSRIQNIGEIPLPKGFERINTKANTFEYYLQHFNLDTQNVVYYFNKTKKENQQSHYAVLDISIGNKNLQQCADAIMRLRAEYFYSKKMWDSIDFKSTYNTYNFKKYLQEQLNKDKAILFQQYLETVFNNCGTYNLADALHPIKNYNDLKVGDVFIKAGSPGHAMIVMDVAQNNKQEKIFLLAQSFMPAQSVHIVINPNDKELSPWYQLDTTTNVITPGYVFNWEHLKVW